MSKREMVAKECEICGKKFKTLAEEPLKICGHCAYEIGDKGISVLPLSKTSKL